MPVLSFDDFDRRYRLAVDMVNGFAKEGLLQSEDSALSIPLQPLKKFKEKDMTVIAFADAHKRFHRATNFRSTVSQELMKGSGGRASKHRRIYAVSQNSVNGFGGCILEWYGRHDRLKTDCNRRLYGYLYSQFRLTQKRPKS